jgi:hypothetical protein
MDGGFTTSRNALAAHKLTQLRREPLACAEYRQLVRHISLLLAYEVTLALPAEEVESRFEVTRLPVYRWGLTRSSCPFCAPASSWRKHFKRSCRKR